MTKNSTIFVMLPSLTERLIVPRVMVASPESPTTEFGSSVISDGQIPILSSVLLRMISAELPVSTNILAIDILNCQFKDKEITGRFDQIGRFSLLEGDNVAACLIRHTVPKSSGGFLSKIICPPAF